MRSTQRFRALVRALALIAPLAWLACGKAARNQDSGSETHWVQSCQADIDCAALGEHVACRAGWCSSDVEVAANDDPIGGALNPAGDGASLADREPAGADTTPRSRETDPLSGLSDAELAAELCDGSERARIIYRGSLGY